MQTIADTEYTNEIDPDAPYGRKKNGQPYKTPQNIRQSIKKYADNHKEQIREATRKWTANNKERHDAYMKEYFKNNREKHLLHMREYKMNQKLELEYYRELFRQGLQTA